MNKYYCKMFFYVNRKIRGNEVTDEALLLSSILTVFLLSFMNLMLVISVVFVLKWYFGFDINIKIEIAYIVLAIMFVINGCIFLPKKRYAKIMKEYAPKEKSALRKESIIYISAYVILLFSLVIVGFIYLLVIK